MIKKVLWSLQGCHWWKLSKNTITPTQYQYAFVKDIICETERHIKTQFLIKQWLLIRTFMSVGSMINEFWRRQEPLEDQAPRKVINNFSLVVQRFVSLAVSLGDIDNENANFHIMLCWCLHAASRCWWDTGEGGGGEGWFGGGGGGRGPPENNGAFDLIYIIAKNTRINNETNCNVLMPSLFLQGQD